MKLFQRMLEKGEPYELEERFDRRRSIVTATRSPVLDDQHGRRVKLLTDRCLYATSRKTLLQFVRLALLKHTLE